MKTNSSLAILALFAFFHLTALESQAQIPRAISYQGTLTTSGGSIPADGLHTITINLYENTSGGTPIFSEVHTTQVNGGRINITIGSVTPMPSSLSFDRPYYLGVAIDGAAEMTPRTAMLPAPYALHAEHAKLADMAVQADLATTATTATQANGLSPTATGAVLSLNGQTGPVTISGLGMTSVTNAGNAFTISSEIANSSLTNLKLNALGVSDGRVLTSLAEQAIWAPVALALPYTQSANSPTSAFEITNAGAGTSISAISTVATGSVAALSGATSSTSHGSGATGGATGVLGLITATTPGGYSAGVRGVNSGTGGTGIGVIGYQGGSGWGVYGETPSGFGIYGLTTNNSAVSVGVRGETFSTNGIGVEAKYSGTGVGVALEVDNGAIRVAGVNKAAFVHTATLANKLSANGTDVDNAMCNGDATAILIVTQKLNPASIVYNNSPIGVYYNTIRNKWEIFNENNVAIPTNAQFNVLVIKQ
jgi:trimeric autotransporter adhesin